MREKFWDISGTQLGNLLKVQKEEAEQQGGEVTKLTEEGEVDYKKSN
jgi:hypothetical protein